jgi:2'-5' RNA ligase
MPNPKKYKNKKKWMRDCLHQTLHVEKKDKNQGLALCLNRWREKGKKVASLFLARDELSGSEALFGFCGWLTTRDKPTTMSSHDDCGHIADLIGTFCKTNALSDPRDDWNKKLTHPKEDSIKASRVIKSFKYREAHSFSSVQCDLPADISQEIYTWGKENIPEEELTGDGRQPEDDIHVTLKYGLHGHDPFEIRPYITEGPIDLTLGEVSIFKNGDADVVKLSVDSPKLHEFNEIVSNNFEHSDTHPTYIPHITISYVKPGYGKKYEGRKDFLGKKIKLDSIVFSGNDNRKTCLPLIS